MTQQDTETPGATLTAEPTIEPAPPPAGTDTETPPAGDESSKPPEDTDTDTDTDVAEVEQQAKAEALTSLQAHVDTETQAAAEKATGERDTFWRDEFQPQFKANSEHLSGVREGIGRFVQSWNDATEDEGLTDDSRKTAQRFVNDNPKLFDALEKMGEETLQAERKQGHWSGVQTVAKGLLEEAGVDSEQVAKLTQRVQGSAQGRSDPTLTADLAKAIVQGAVAKAIEARTAELEKTIRANVEAEANAEARKNRKPPAPTDAGTGGGGKKAYKDEVGQLSSEDIDARTREFVAAQT